MGPEHPALLFGSSLLMLGIMAEFGHGQETPTAVTIAIEEVVDRPRKQSQPEIAVDGRPKTYPQALRAVSQQNANGKTRTERLVVLPVAYPEESEKAFRAEIEKTFGIANAPSMQQPDFNLHLVNALVHRKKLRVLERQALSQVVKEIDFGKSDYADPERAVEIGHILNADFVVIARIRSLRLKRKENKVPYIPKVDVEVSGVMATAVRVVDVKTGTIVYSRIGHAKHTERLTKEAGGADAAFGFTDNLFASAAVKEAARIIAVTSPMKIIEIDLAKGTVILQAGAEEVEEGDVLSVIQPDAKGADAHEQSPTTVGRLKVRKVHPDRIEATIEQGVVKKDFVFMLMS